MLLESIVDDSIKKFCKNFKQICENKIVSNLIFLEPYWTYMSNLCNYGGLMTPGY